MNYWALGLIFSFALNVVLLSLLGAAERDRKRAVDDRNQAIRAGNEHEAQIRELLRTRRRATRERFLGIIEESRSA
jgi:uncharacterized membrane protein